MTPARGPWYLSAKAVRDYLALCRREGLLVSNGRPARTPQPALDDDELFDRGAVALQRMAEETVASGRQPKRMESGALRYRGPRPLRLGLVVVDAPRPEGDLPQLVGVLPGHGGGHAPRR